MQIKAEFRLVIHVSVLPEARGNAAENANKALQLEVDQMLSSIYIIYVSVEKVPWSELQFILIFPAIELGHQIIIIMVNQR